jgi:hypothetical protein
MRRLTARFDEALKLFAEPQTRIETSPAPTNQQAFWPSQRRAGVGDGLVGWISQRQPRSHDL